MMAIKLETDRLELREFKIEDKTKLHNICGENHILKWMPDWNVDIDIREKWIKWVNENYTTSNSDNVRIMLAIELKSNKELIGMIGVGNKEEVDNEVEIAFFITKGRMNNGYISEAGTVMSIWAIEHFCLEYLMAIADVYNYASQRVLDKVGFKKIGEKEILNSGESQKKLYYYYRYYK